MIPLLCTISGAIGISAGLGRTTLKLDLTSIPNEALTVAIIGDNGSGKSTLLNLGLTPWREPPMLSGNVYSHFGETGKRELEWTHNERLYRTLIEYKQTAKTRTQRAYLHVLDINSEWRPIILEDHTRSDGKSSTYDKCLESILGPRDIYYLSAFRAQGAAKLAEHDDPKGLMRDLLHLDETAKLGDRARDVARELTREHDTLRRSIERLDNHEDSIGTLRRSIGALLEGQADRLKAKSNADEALSMSKAELDRAMSDGLDQRRIIDQRAAVEIRLREVKQAGAIRVTDRENVLASARMRSADAGLAHTRTINGMSEAAERANARARTAHQLLSRRDEIAEAEAQAQALQMRIAATEQDKAVTDQTIKEMSQLAAEAAKCRGELKHVESAGKAQASLCKDLHHRAGYVDTVPCGGKEPYNTCPALHDAMMAAEQASLAEEERAAKVLEWERLSAEITDLREKTHDLPAEQEQQRQLNSMLRDLRTQLSSASRLAAEQVAIEQAEKIKDEANEENAEITARIISAKTEHLIIKERLNEAVVQARKSVVDAMTAAQDAEVVVQAELDALPEAGPTQAIDKAKEILENAELRVQAAADNLQNASAKKAGFDAEINRLTKELEDSKETSTEVDRLGAEIAEWTLLGHAMRGVIDLTIEDAGPGIAVIANRLLTEAYGPRFSVRIVTQHKQVNGRLVECFDIFVIDADTGLESSILMKSGGESVWIDKALTDAVALYQQEAAGVDYECLFADEAEDGLTQERKAMFYKMDRAALAIGGYRRKFTVSHNPEAWALADHVINLADYKEVA